jgi:predicted small lipoprotein YifL
MSPLKVALAAAALVALAGCGKMGALDRPGPLFGADRATTRAADEAQAQAQDPNRPVDTVDPRDRTTDPAPPRTLPIEGAPRDPNRPAPQGAIPDPFANPR